MKLFKDINKDLSALKVKYGLSYFMAIISNRGFHSLFFYRVSHALWNLKIPILPLILTRFVQVMYAIDIDYKSKLEGGIIIIHGVGIVVGYKAYISEGTIIYQQVTLGEKGSRFNDGHPFIGKNVILGAGSKLLGGIKIGDNSIIGPNVVLLDSVDEKTIVKVMPNQIKKRK
ncbi:serine O-acetyltransferase [Algibacter lectus]|uniref:serine O-acetyltransferase n=1 Tax=Algibacter lectus TaxID=221126 RepID=UPI0026EB3FCE|nr:DapH/DapD/GlmU-related protein [Algibacter lectus]MDO7137090.1 DapH/DapD/GlmU-related protein [Algibacter lectus]